jgi:hypothetical protein
MNTLRSFDVSGKSTSRNNRLLYLAYVGRRAREISDCRAILARRASRSAARSAPGSASWPSGDAICTRSPTANAPSPLKPLSPEAANSREFTPTPPRS